MEAIATYLKETGDIVNSELAEAILMAQGEIYAEEWKKAIDKNIRTNRSTGAMKNSVKAKLKRGETLSVEIAPTGKDKKGVRNAEKAFIHNYGKKGQKGSRFVTLAENNAKEAALEAAQKIMNEYISGK